MNAAGPFRVMPFRRTVVETARSWPDEVREARRVLDTKVVPLVDGELRLLVQYPHEASVLQLYALRRLDIADPDPNVGRSVLDHLLRVAAGACGCVSFVVCSPFLQLTFDILSCAELTHQTKILFLKSQVGHQPIQPSAAEKMPLCHF